MFCYSKTESLGIGKVVDIDPATANVIVEYFDSPTAPNRKRFTYRYEQLVAIKELDSQTRVYFLDVALNCWLIGRIEGHIDAVCYIALPNGQQARVNESEVFVRWDAPISNPCDHLSARLSETPFYHNARSKLVASLIDQRRACAGMTALLSSPVEIERHQVEVVRRVLSDPVQRYLLADEVGLGKTIEAGLILRQHILDFPESHRVMVFVPETLREQWDDELKRRLQIGESFGHHVEVLSHHDLLKVRKDAERTFIVVDEAHQIVSGWQSVTPQNNSESIFTALVEFSHPNDCPSLLLLSATPVRGHAVEFLGLLHLLDPTLYPLSGADAFRAKIDARQELADIYYGLTENQPKFFISGFADRLSALLPADKRLTGLLLSLRPLLQFHSPDDSPERRGLIQAIRAHLSETHRLHRRLLRNRRNEELIGLLPGRTGLLRIPIDDPLISLLHHWLENWRLAALAFLWGREDSEEARELADLHYLLLEALMCDLYIFEAHIINRLEKKITRRESFNSPVYPTDSDHLITGAAIFPEEVRLLTEMVAILAKQAAKEAIPHKLIMEVCEAELSKGIRVLLMCSTKESADRVYHFLKEARGRGVFRHKIREDDSWKTFQDTEQASILVCDCRAEEGLNLQGGQASLFHLDLPLSPNRIEQRLGRLDRFGAGRGVRSLALDWKDSPLRSSWASLLADTWKVFSRSIAGLQYLVEEEEKKLRLELFIKGAEALSDASGRLGGQKGLIETEFTSVRAQDELDSIEVFPGDEGDDIAGRIEELEKNQELIEKSFRGWMEGCLGFYVAGEESINDSVLRYHYRRSDYGKQTLVSRREVLRCFKAAFDDNARHKTLTWKPLSWPLAFARITATKRHVGVGRIGNPVVDGTRFSLGNEDRGICFAFLRQTDLLSSGEINVYFRFDFVVEANLQTGKLGWADSPFFQRRADSAFAPILSTIWCVADGSILKDDSLLEVLRAEYDRDRDHNLNVKQWAELKLHFPLDSWQTTCEQAYKAAHAEFLRKTELQKIIKNCESRARDRMAVAKEQLESRVDATMAGTAENQSAIRDLTQEMSLYQALRPVISNPLVRLDSIGAVFLVGRK